MTSETLRKFISEIQEQIIVDELETAIDMLLNYLVASDHKLQNELILYSARYNRLRIDQRKGVIERKDARIEQAQIENSVLDLLEDLSNSVEDTLLPTPSVVSVSDSFQSMFEPTQEKILGINNLKQISWIQQAIRASRSVCRVLTPSGFGTGFLIDHDKIMTNNHVISNKDIANESFAEFNYEQGSNGEHLPSFRFKLIPDIFHTSPSNELDYSIIGIEINKQQSNFQWGFLPLNPNATPLPNEHVVIIQHPNGGLKQISLTSNRVVNTQNKHIFYTTDTMPGSSGSPIFNDLWQVVGIHHAYGGIKQDNRNNNYYANEGILMSHIKPDAQLYWPNH